jgi:hypothetical protein
MQRNARQVTRVIKIKAFWSGLPHTRKTRGTRPELRRAREAVVLHGRRTHRLSRNEPYWELRNHKDILARRPQSRDSEIELPDRAGRPAGHCSRLAVEHFPASLNVYTISGSRWLTRQPATGS